MKCDWRCTRCDLRLGRVVDQTVTLKHKQEVNKVEGRGAVVSTRCRRCGTVNKTKLN